MRPGRVAARHGTGIGMRSGRSGPFGAAAMAIVLATMVGACSAWPGQGNANAPATSGAAPAASGSTAASPGTQTSAPPLPSASQAQSPPASGVATGERLPGEPDPRLTPGAVNPAVTQATIHQTICVAGWTATVRPPASYTTELKREQIAAYGYTDTSLASYEEDHLVPLEVGGAPADPSNLWPEPYAATLADGTPVGARVKDHLENDLHDRVCAGTLSLRDAQADFLDGWVHAWLAEGH